VTTVVPGDADAVLAAGRVQAWAVGSGLPPGAPTTKVVGALLAVPVPLLLDAGALGAFAELFATGHPAARSRAAPMLLTPHDGEFVRLTSTALGWDAEATTAELAVDRLGLARRAAAGLRTTVLLKGARTLVAEPSGQARVNTTGTPHLATAGSGDVLTGLCGALLATGLTALDAGSVGAWLHGRAAELAGPGLSAADLPGLLVAVLAELAR
jgi:ADP-dependent NAD(P)H-hydrate dehydratase / NAD(P)H-hydrate epimerase